MEHVIDATGKSFGRLASEVALLLRGKNSPTFRPNVAPTNKVVINNAGKIKMTGNKLGQKIYTRHSSYPGGLKSEVLEEVIEKKGASEVIRRAVYGMLPSNRLRKIMMSNLTINE